MKPPPFYYPNDLDTPEDMRLFVYRAASDRYWEASKKPWSGLSDAMKRPWIIQVWSEWEGKNKLG